MTRIPLFLMVLLLTPAAAFATRPTGNSAVFIHPDGTGLAGWNLYRILEYGPDGNSHWDQLPGIAVYRSHMKDRLNASSHGGGTVHAYGVKVPRDSYGMHGQEPVRSASDYPGSLMQEAQAAGITVGIINSGHLAEPGTGCMLASVQQRKMLEEIAVQLIESGADLLMGGGEVLFLPEGTVGRHGEAGVRSDGRNLVTEAEAAGYTVLYTREDLQHLDPATPKVLGLFAAKDTYNSMSEERLRELQLPLYDETCPTVAEMLEAALAWASARPEPFFLMAEEEGTDNFPNALNARGMFEAFRRADAAIGVVEQYRQTNPELSLIVAADSEASGPELIDFGQMTPDNPQANQPLPATLRTGAPLSGTQGKQTPPFVSAPDQFGQRHLFGVGWTDHSDKYGSVLVRTSGPITDNLPTNLDNTEIFEQLHKILLSEAKD